MLKKMVWILGILLVVTVIAATIIVLQKKGDLPMISPLGVKFVEKKEVKKPEMEMVGFLPTWMVGKTKVYGKELTQLIFLGIEVNANGSLLWDAQSRKIYNPEFLELRNSVKQNGGKVILGIKLFEDEKLDKFIQNQNARDNLMREVATIVKGGEFDGVNIDFEYMSNPTRILDDDFGTYFVDMRKSGWGRIGVDVFANTIIKGDPDRLRTFLSRIDEVVVMAYDFHRPGSDFAGAVAPMDAAPGERSIGEILRKISDENLDRSKFIMAYPLYGYEWQTATNENGSVTETGGYGKTVFYEDGIGFTGITMDPVAQSPWVAWVEKEKRTNTITRRVGRRTVRETNTYFVDQWHQAYFENEDSLRVKLLAAKQAQLLGVGFWALGYEGINSNLLQDLRGVILEK